LIIAGIMLIGWQFFADKKAFSSSLSICF